MSNVETSAWPRLTPDQIAQVANLLENGGGVTYDEIARAIGYGPTRPLFPADGPSELEVHLLQQIAKGNARRVWNKAAGDHFYMVND